MAETKKEVLSKLYFLRAMMSKMAAISDEREEIEERIDDIEQREFVPSVKLESNLPECKEKKEKLRAELQQWRENETASDAEIEKKEKEVEKNRPYSVAENVIPCIVFDGIISVILFFLIRWWVNSDFSFWVGLLVVPISFFGIIFFIGMICVNTPSYHRKELQKQLKQIEEKRTEVSQIRVEITKIEEEITQIEKQIYIQENQESINNELIKQEYAEFCKLNKDERKELTKVQDKLLDDVAVIYKSAKDLSIIDESDWANLDVIIYELETGRADTMKEALHQADLYNRHNEMIKAIKNASKAISVSISQNINDLKHSIGLQVKALRADINELNESQRAIEGKLGDMLDAQELSNVLLEKANESSKDLAKNIEYIKDIKYREYYGIEHL